MYQKVQDITCNILINLIFFVKRVKRDIHKVYEILRIISVWNKHPLPEGRLVYHATQKKPPLIKTILGLFSRQLIVTTLLLWLEILSIFFSKHQGLCGFVYLMDHGDLLSLHLWFLKNYIKEIDLISIQILS